MQKHNSNRRRMNSKNKLISVVLIVVIILLLLLGLKGCSHHHEANTDSNHSSLTEAEQAQLEAFENESFINESGSSYAASPNEDTNGDLVWGYEGGTRLSDSEVYYEAKVMADTIYFNANEVGSSNDLNARAYQISNYFAKHSGITNIPRDWCDPLFALAVSVVEWKGSATECGLWSAAMPVNFLPPEKQIADYMDTMTIADISDSVTGDWNSSYWGSLQMSKDYGAYYALDPSLLHGSEYLNLINYREDHAIPNYIPPNRINKNAIAGDRFNWSDACNRFYGAMNYLYGTYRNRGIGEVTNKYSYMALMSIAHNSGNACLIGEGYNLKNTYGFWIYESNSDVVAYANELSNINVLVDLRTRAHTAVRNYRETGELSIRLDNSVATRTLCQDYINKGWIKPGHWIDKSATNEKVGYPVQVLYAYFVLQYLYSGN